MSQSDPNSPKSAEVESQFGAATDEPSILVKAARAARRAFGLHTGTNTLPTIDLNAPEQSDPSLKSASAKIRAAHPDFDRKPGQFHKNEKSWGQKLFSEVTNMNRMVAGFVKSEEKRQTEAPAIGNRRVQVSPNFQPQSSNIAFVLTWLAIASILVGGVYVAKSKPLWFRQLSATFIKLKKDPGRRPDANDTEN